MADKQSSSTNKKIGTVTHYYDKISVAVIKLASGSIKVGDEVKFGSKEDNEFTQKVTSMQIEHAEIDIAKKGDEFGLKVDKEVKAGTPLSKV
ncbi:MAG: EF-Tu/IF-2/RF-3 family GTPase [Candidatus Curtissbacteria bacterium]|nr:EF-Tu/IF-2/RF-3 family GTPase [Candidatus Curtissbacteria bacterium]